MFAAAIRKFPPEPDDVWISVFRYFLCLNAYFVWMKRNRRVT
jgi:hypothetical protein